ncbi:hypothetical protein QTI66_27055 [Variovorax sp. J22R133]|uniref:hypothetical protein n=1 Tax=Variovorax brevis TaxID=3053503 RepID=UPI002579050F|nr:hypothetical protein [Variovorax sp. J22R133]MDM0115837.1 hypothetical protein [Variovorax sp. J22R133]
MTPLGDRQRHPLPPACTRATAALLALLLAGCNAVGPQLVARDRFDYNSEISRSWKEQTLLNIVRSRYSDLPMFLEVAQIVSGYTLESTVSTGVTGARADALAPPGTNVTLGAQGKWTDRPTITYTPLTGAQFNRNMLTPIPPAAVLFAMQAGWPIDLVFRVVVRSINGLDSTGRGAERYERLVVLMRTLQDAEVVGMRVQAGDKPEHQAVVLFFRPRALSAEQEAMVNELRSLMSLTPGRTEYRVSFGAASPNEGEIAMLTRSMLQILVDLGEYVDVPEADVQEGRTATSRAPSSAVLGRLLKVNFSAERSPDAIVQVNYRGRWFWIDDRDIASKRTFALVMIFSTLSETGARESMPLVTIPAG